MDISIIYNKNHESFSMCRACMVNITPPDACKPLFSDRIAEMYTTCTNIEVGNSDGLPSNVCLRCFQTLYMVYAFKEQCIASDLKLKELLKTNASLVKEPYISTRNANCSGIKVEDDYVSEDEDQHSKKWISTDSNLYNNSIHSSKYIDPPNYQPGNYLAVKEKPLGYFKLEAAISTSDERKFQDERIRYTKVSEINGLQISVTGKQQDLKRKLVAHEVCIECGHKFASKRILRRHMLQNHTLVHISDTPFPCKFCDKKFNTKLAVEEHTVRLHVSNKNNACRSCEKRDMTLRELAKHMQIHSKERPFVCSVCNKRFTTKTYLTTHTRSHTGNRPYACDLCPKSFTQSNVLKNHRMTHTGEKPHVCVVCLRAFRQRVARDKHMKIHRRQLGPI